MYCNKCETKLVSALDVAGNGQELVCPDCGVTLSLFDLTIGAEKYGRSPTSIAVLGNGLGMNHSTKNADGSSNIYAWRGNNGKYGKPKGKNKESENKGVRKLTVLSDIREYNLKNLEEHNQKIGDFKMNLSRRLLRAGGRDQSLLLYKLNVQAKAEDMEGPVLIGSEGRFLLYESRAGVRTFHDPKPTDRQALPNKKKDEPVILKCTCYYCKKGILLEAREFPESNVCEAPNVEELQALLGHGRIHRKEISSGRSLSEEQIAKVAEPLIRAAIKAEEDIEHLKTDPDDKNLILSNPDRFVALEFKRMMENPLVQNEIRANEELKLLA